MVGGVRTLSFLTGLVFGVFALLIAQNLGFLRPRERPRPVVDLAAARGAEGRSEAATLSPEGRAAQEELAAKIGREVGDPQGKNLDALAIALEEAFFEQNWEKVLAVAAAIRARGAEWVAPPVAPAPSAPEEKSLFDQDLEHWRKMYEAALAHRRNAATALAGKTDERSIAELRRILETSGGTERGDAAWLLARSGDERAQRELLEALRAPAHDLRVAAGTALAREGSLAGAREAASILASEPDAAIRETAVACLGQFDATRRGEPQHPATRAFLEAFRKDGDARVRREGARLLGYADLENGRALLDALFDALQNDTSARVRAEAMAALAQFAPLHGAPPGSLEAVASDLQLEKNAEVEAKMIAYLEEYGDAAALRALDSFAATAYATQVAGQVEEARKTLAERLAAR
jgi:HEAT repeat protein